MPPKQPKKGTGQTKLTAFKFGFLNRTDQASPPQPVAAIPTPAPLPPRPPRRKPGRPKKKPAASVLSSAEAAPLPEEIVNEHPPSEHTSEVVTVKLVPLQSRPSGAPWAQQHRGPLVKVKLKVVSAAKRSRRTYTDEEKQLALRILHKCGGSASSAAKTIVLQQYELFPSHPPMSVVSSWCSVLPWLACGCLQQLRVQQYLSSPLLQPAV